METLPSAPAAAGLGEGHGDAAVVVGVARVVVDVEDDAEAAEYLAKGLRESGHAAEVVDDGRDGLLQAATGRFDDEQLFYLRSRGVSEKESRRLVVHGFFNDLIRKVGIPSIEAQLLETVEAELAKNVLKDLPEDGA